MIQHSISTCIVEETLLSFYSSHFNLTIYLRFHSQRAPNQGKQQSAGKEDAAMSKTADVELSGEGSSDLKKPWYSCPLMGIRHPCFYLGLLISTSVIFGLLFYLVRSVIKWLHL